MALKSSPYLSLVSVHVGENVTLNCSYQGTVAVIFYWYKQTLDQKPQQVSTFYKHDSNGTFSDGFNNNRRFELETGAGKNHLKILNVQISDSATYFCIAGFSYVYEFLEGITVHIKGSGLDLLVHQSASESIQPGGSVTLKCTAHTGTCDGEHSVYWFRRSEESRPGFIYTHGGRNDQCETNTATHKCVYSLPMKDLRISHAGTYYCAVASCGHIVFGNGTTLHFEEAAHSVALLYILCGALAFSIVLVIILGYTSYKMYTPNSCTDPHHRSSAASGPNAEGSQDANSLHYAALSVIRVSKSRRQRDDTQLECVYSRVRQ
ncbi:uncharacterized protein LOC114450881 [Parambassis ranga]|uniref:Uncharacterized protein LOC114450881 n=1 Tax=Parambassis ranga TaxID=210632 RepID=A0A6P7K6U1_9TELE|nr:uncharacterized protein LOC114450881 [Parambassis ranga]